MNQELAAERKKNSKPLAKLKQDSHFLKKKIDQYHVSITSLAVSSQPSTQLASLL